MRAELSALEDKVRQLIALCAALRHDNLALREQLLTADRVNKRLATQMTEAAQRLDVVLAQLPGDGK
jgi:cell division protein ZapB